MQCQRLYVRLHGGCDSEQFGIGTVGLLRNEVARGSISRPSGLDQPPGTSNGSNCWATTGESFSSFWEVLMPWVKSNRLLIASLRKSIPLA